MYKNEEFEINNQYDKELLEMLDLDRYGNLDRAKKVISYIASYDEKALLDLRNHIDVLLKNKNKSSLIEKIKGRFYG